MTDPQPHLRRIKTISFILDGVEYSTQITSWKVSTGDKVGDRVYTQSIAGEGHNSTIEETDGTPTLDITFGADFRAAGISDKLWQHHNEIVEYSLDHHPDIPEEHIQFSGLVQLKAPDVGDDSRKTEIQETNMPIIGPIPAYERV